MESLRTPDECFADLPGYPFEPHYVEIDDGDGGTLRMHYVDEGPRDAAPILLMHGEPAWSYLYRKMIPPLAAAGHRVIALDLVGFGRSDKPALRSDYTYTRHVAWVERALLALDLSAATFFGQDWGSIVGLAVVARNEDRFERIVIANGALPDPRKAEAMGKALSTSSNPDAFGMWQRAVAALDEMDVAELMGKSTLNGVGVPGINPPPISDEEAAAYAAPYPSKELQGGVLAFPALGTPQGDDDDVFGTWVAAWDVLERWTKPFLCLYGKADPVLGFFDRVFIEHVPGAAGQPHQQFEGIGHFIQEEKPDELVAAINSLIASG